jgi:hypothetical protein
MVEETCGGSYSVTSNLLDSFTSSSKHQSKPQIRSVSPEYFCHPRRGILCYHACRTMNFILQEETDVGHSTRSAFPALGIGFERG